MKRRVWLDHWSLWLML